MPHDYASWPRHEPRRRDRAVTDDAWIRAMLHHAPYGALATVADGQPFVHTNLFVYDEAGHCLYFHTARVGRTRANVEGGAPACFSVSTMGRLLPAAAALEFSVEYAGVTVFGTADVLTDPTDARRALQLLLDKYAPHLRPGRDYHPITDDELARTAVYCLTIEDWSGKKKKAPTDFSGAYRYEDVVPPLTASPPPGE